MKKSSFFQLESVDGLIVAASPKSVTGYSGTRLVVPLRNKKGLIFSQKTLPISSFLLLKSIERRIDSLGPPGELLRTKYFSELHSGLIVVKHLRFLDILYLLRSELEVLCDFFPSFLTMLSIEDVCTFVVKCLVWPEENFVSFTKFHTACPLAFYFRDELPKNPSMEFFPKRFSFLIWEGKTKQLLRNRLSSRLCVKTCRLFMGYLQGIKRGTLQVGEDFVFKSLCDHMVAMTTPPSNPVEFLLDFVPLSDKLFFKKSILKRKGKVTTLTKNVRAIDRTLVEISRAASFIHQRKAGGGRREIRQILLSEQGLFEPQVWSLETLNHKGKEDDMLFLFPTDNLDLHIMKETRPGIIKEVKMVVPVVNRKSIESHVNEEIQSDEPAKVAVGAILEPIKVRLITVGSSWLTYLCKAVQRDLWTTNSYFPQFVLTTRPLSVIDFHSLVNLEKSFHFSLNGECDGTEYSLSLSDTFNYTSSFWNSGDYKAATDNLDIRLTKLILESYFPWRDLSELEILACRRILYEQELVYRSDSDTENALFEFMESKGIESESLGSPSVIQQNGQLMGSVLSFPILCIANLLCYWNALRRYVWCISEQRNVSLSFSNYTGSKGLQSWVSDLSGLHGYSPSRIYEICETMPLDFGSLWNPKELPVLVNGDDILFRSNPLFNLIWEKYGYTRAGFVKSTGKNYIVRDFLTINSECYHIQYRKEEDSFETDHGKRFYPEHYTKVDFLNVGLLLGSGGKFTRGFNANPFKGVESLPLTDQYNLMISAACDPLRAHRRFIHYRRDEIEHFSKKGLMNFFGSVYLGGMGAIPPKDIPLDILFTDRQLRYASHLYSTYQGYQSNFHTISHEEFSSKFPKVSFVDRLSSNFPYPVSQGHFLNFRMDLLGQGPLLNCEREYCPPKENKPLLFDHGIPGEQGYQVKGLKVSFFRKKSVKKVSSRLTDRAILLYFKPRVILQKHLMPSKETLLEYDCNGFLRDSQGG